MWPRRRWRTHFLVDANPSSKDHIDALPKTIKLKFGAGVEPAYSTLSIETADGKVLAKGAVGKPETPRELTLDAPADLAPGRYVVRFACSRRTATSSRAITNSSSTRRSREHSPVSRSRGSPWSCR